jgi:GntR family transcriptional regulator
MLHALSQLRQKGMVSIASTASVSVRTSPLYLWVASLLRDGIEAGRSVPHSPVPSERVLSERYGISRMTARHALETLVTEGSVYRDARRGTFVAERRLRFSVGSFTRVMTEGDHVPGCEVLAASTLDPDPVISEALDLPAGSKVHLIQRLRTARAEPMAIENIHVSAERFPDLLAFDLTGSLWELLRTRYGVHPTKADARVVAVTLDPFEAETLNAKVGSPAIALTRTVYSANGEVVELARDVYRGDRAEFYVTAPVEPVAGEASRPVRA